MADVVQGTEDAVAPAEAEQSPAETRFYDAARLHFRRDGARLTLCEDGGPDTRDVKLVRLFPLSETEAWIAVVDEKGKELGILRTLGGLAADDLAAARLELHQRYLVPAITRILAVRERFDMHEWTVETDRGPAVFLTRNEREEIRQPLGRRVTIADVEGNRYDIPDIDALDTQSRAWLEQQM